MDRRSDADRAGTGNAPPSDEPGRGAPWSSADRIRGRRAKPGALPSQP